MLRSIALAILVGAACSAVAEAQEARVRFVFRSPSIGFFEHQVTVKGLDADRLQSPSPADLKPYLRDAQKALADREGYTERLYGANHYTLASNKLVESTVVDGSGRTLYTSRDPLENRNRDPQPVRTIKTFETSEAPEPVMGFAPVESRATRAHRQAAAQVRNSPFLRHSEE